MHDISLYEKIPNLKNSFPVKIAFGKATESSLLFRHWHEHIELLFFTSGICEVCCNENSFIAKSGDLVVVNKNHLHYFNTASNAEYYYVIIYPPFFNDVDFKNIFLQEFISGDPFVRRCIENMHAEASKQQLGSDMRLKGYTYQLISHLIQNYETVRISDKEYNSHMEKLERLNNVLTYISEHYQEKIYIAQLARMCYMTECHFCRFFKKTIGKSAVSYINELRVEKAAVLLKNTRDSVAYIGECVSFDDANYFTRVFKKIKGVSPAKFRSLQ